MNRSENKTKMTPALALIPARGGSKRIKNKNSRQFCGRPILEYSIETALRSGLFEKVIVSTDSEQIAELARANGAEVPFMRPAELANDTATTAKVLVHALDWYHERGIEWEWFSCIYPTAVFVEPDQLCSAAKLLKGSEIPAVLTVCRFDYPIQRSIRINGEGTLEWNWPEHELTRSQDLEDAYHDAGQFYMLAAKAFRSNPRLMPPGAVPYLLDSKQVVDIDTEEDWEMAEQTYRVVKL